MRFLRVFSPCFLINCEVRTRSLSSVNGNRLKIPICQVCHGCQISTNKFIMRYYGGGQVLFQRYTSLVRFSCEVSVSSSGGAVGFTCQFGVSVIDIDVFERNKAFHKSYLERLGNKPQLERAGLSGWGLLASSLPLEETFREEAFKRGWGV